jgi:hypothetical protein
MEVVPVWRRAVQADLQDNSIARQRSQYFPAPPGKQHSVRQHRGRSGRSAGKQNLADIFQQKRLRRFWDSVVRATPSGEQLGQN